MDLRNHDISQWNHDWKAKRTTPVYGEWKFEEKEYEISVITSGEFGGTKGIQRKLTFYTYRPGIRMEAEFIKEPVCEPESILFAVPAKFEEGWECCYDTAGEMVKLDEEQLGRTCRDYQTVDTAVSIYDKSGCLTLCCPDAPMIQVGDFQFGKENEKIPRVENPLLLAWPLNNYWTTNFMANQSGRMVFAYELNFHESFSRREMFADGIRLKQPVATGLTVHTSGRKDCLIKGEGNCEILNVFPNRKGDGMLVLIKNQENSPAECVLHSPMRKMGSAAVVNSCEEVLEELSAEGDKVAFAVPARRLMLIEWKF